MRAKKVTTAAVVTNAPTTAPPPPKYDRPRFDPTKSPTKKPIYKKASDYMTKYSTKRRNSRFIQLCCNLAFEHLQQIKLSSFKDHNEIDNHADLVHDGESHHEEDGRLHRLHGAVAVQDLRVLLRRLQEGQGRRQGAVRHGRRLRLRSQRVRGRRRLPLSRPPLAAVRGADGRALYEEHSHSTLEGTGG